MVSNVEGRLLKDVLFCVKLEAWEYQTCLIKNKTKDQLWSLNVAQPVGNIVFEMKALHPSLSLKHQP